MAGSKKDYRFEIGKLTGEFNKFSLMILLVLGWMWWDIRDIREDVGKIKASLEAQLLYTNNNQKVGASGQVDP